MTQELHREGLQAYERRDWADAERCFRQVVGSDPGRRDAWDHLGNALIEQKRVPEAEAAWLRALEVDATYAPALHHLGRLRAQQGRRDEAVSLQRAAVAARPDFHPAWMSLGDVLKAIGRPEEAVAAYRSAVDLRPDHAESWNNYGTSLRAAGRVDEAIEAYRTAIAKNPRLPQPHNNLGNALAKLGRNDEAVPAYREALARRDSQDTRLGLAGALTALGQLAEAEKELRGVLVTAPLSARALGQLATVLREQGRLTEARTAGEAAVAADPGLSVAHNRLGNVYMELGDTDRAIASFQKAVALDPVGGEASVNLGHVLADAKRFSEAVAAYDEAFRRDPSDTRALALSLYNRRVRCDWTRAEEDESRLLADLRQPVEPFVLSALDATPEQQHRNAEAWMKRYYPVSRPRPPWRHADPTRSGGRFRIGYLSSDLRDHAVGWLVGEVLAAHDRAEVEVIALSTRRDGGATQARIAREVDRFVDLSPQSHAQAARTVRELGVDVLVELNGHTLGARPAILGEGAAPVQVTWLGYPGTLGGGVADYAIVDEVVAPPEEEGTFSEKLVWLPFSYQPADTRHVVGPGPSRAECGLPEGALVLASFNAPHKLTPRTFSLWMRILGEVSASVLWLLEGSANVAENLRREAASRGIEPGRLVFAPKLPHAAHLARHAHADLFLDNLPYGAHTTASDALWMGRPVITLLGRAFPGRVAASVLQALGVPSLITRTEEEYVALAVRLARDPVARAEIGESIDRQRSAGRMFDPRGFAGHLEAAYRQMAARAAQGLPARSFRVAPPSR